jgi:flavodoxin
MSKKIVYFSRSGNAKRIAEKISGGIESSEIVEITTDVSWKYFLGFIKGGFYTSTDKDLDITLSSPIETTDEIILVAPLWAGKACQPARMFLKKYDNKTDILLTSSATISSEKYEIGSVVSSFSITKKLKNEDAIIEEIVAI